MRLVIQKTVVWLLCFVSVGLLSSCGFFGADDPTWVAAGYDLDRLVLTMEEAPLVVSEFETDAGDEPEVWPCGIAGKTTEEEESIIHAFELEGQLIAHVWVERFVDAATAQRSIDEFNDLVDSCGGGSMALSDDWAHISFFAGRARTDFAATAFYAEEPQGTPFLHTEYAGTIVHNLMVYVQVGGIPDDSPLDSVVEAAETLLSAQERKAVALLNEHGFSVES